MMTPRVTVALEPDTLRSAQLGALLHGLDLHDYINIVVLQWIQAANGVLLAQPAREQAAPLAEVLAYGIVAKATGHRILVHGIEPGTRLHHGFFRGQGGK